MAWASSSAKGRGPNLLRYWLFSTTNEVVGSNSPVVGLPRMRAGEQGGWGAEGRGDFFLGFDFLLDEGQGAGTG